MGAEILVGDNSFEARHIGPSVDEQREMLATLGIASLEALTEAVVPACLVPASLTHANKALNFGAYTQPRSESETLALLRTIADKNHVFRSYIGCGYYNCHTPTVILRNILENPAWYTQYTPYQSEISQGRLEALLNFQTMVSDLTGLPVSNASLLDESTAAAEAMTLSLQAWKKNADSGNSEDGSGTFLVSKNCHPQTIALIRTRAAGLDIKISEIDFSSASKPDFAAIFTPAVFGVLLQYPNSDGSIQNPKAIIEAAHQAGALVSVATDLLALALLVPPGELGADIAVGSAQRFGVPLGFGGPHAAFFSVKDEFKRLLPGRIVGVSKDNAGNQALRLSLQTREQHIRREKATSNICTAQALLANIASMFAVYHGPAGIKKIASEVACMTARLAQALVKGNFKINATAFDTITIELQGSGAARFLALAEAKKINLRLHAVLQTITCLSISLDETVNENTLADLAAVFSVNLAADSNTIEPLIPKDLKRTSSFLTHPVFNSYHSETEFLRYCKKLELRDLSLAIAMIPLGSCTMKLNATTEMIPVTWPEFGALHPFAPRAQWNGYAQLFSELEQMLASITGFDGVSLQPNSGAQGEYAGLLAIRNYHLSRGDKHRTVCLIPKSAHGTNPASAVMAGMKVVVVECDENGNISVADLKEKALMHKADLAALMVTYPSTHGVFEGAITEITEFVHSLGGQVYMDGANLNALVGLVRPFDIGADVCHINLHKTFCIPHGGGGPGMGPIACRKHLTPFLPGHPFALNENGSAVTGPVSAAPYGSASILVISWAYIVMMGAAGLRRASQVAILNANYVSKLLEADFPTLYRGQNGLVAHECILDLRDFKRTAGIEVDDIAKRLMDYGFHAPTVSWPVIGTVMVEPTESENKRELDRFVRAMKAIAAEARCIISGEFDALDNPLKGAPHTASAVCSDNWNRKYSRELAAFPTKETRDSKFWPTVGRIDGNFGDRNLICNCLPLDKY